MYKIDITEDLEGVFAYEYGKMINHYVSLPYIKNDSLFLNLENIEFTFGEKTITDQLFQQNKYSVVQQISNNVNLDSPYFDICVILRKACIEIQHYKNFSLQKKSSINTSWKTTGLSFLKNDLIFYFTGNSLEL